MFLKENSSINNIYEGNDFTTKQLINIVDLEYRKFKDNFYRSILSQKESYCGLYYNNQSKYINKLQSLGINKPRYHDKPYSPLILVSEKFSKDNIIKLEDIPSGLFNKNPIDEFLYNDKAQKFRDKLGYKYQEIDDPNNLRKAFNSYFKGPIKQKKKAQQYEANRLRNELEIIKKIESDKYKPEKPNEFTLSERGHIRYIKAPSAKDQVVQRSLNDNVLIPKVKEKLIYDNGASLKGKGISFTRARFKHHLQLACKEYNNIDEGYILFIDYSKYFDNIFHDKALEEFSKILTPIQLEFVKKCFSEFEIDVSYMEDDEFELIDNIVFNSLEYNTYINLNSNIKASLNKSKILHRSLGIGNHIAQITGVFYPTPIDNYCKIVRGIKYYGRYMDDTYIILRTKEEAKELLSVLDVLCKDHGLFINMKKTRICSIHGWNMFLKVNYFVTPTYKVIEKPVVETFKREWRRLTAFKRLLDKHLITLETIKGCYRSWRGSYIKFDSKLEIFDIDKYFISLFGTDWKL